MKDSLLQNINDNTFPESLTPNIKMNCVLCQVHSKQTVKNEAYTDHTGRFPFLSGRSLQYVLIG